MTQKIPLSPSRCRGSRAQPWCASRSRCLAALVGVALFAAVSGCGPTGERFLPVAGKVTLDGKPLPVGAVSFRPDASKGNKSMHIPTGEINAQGNYVLETTGKKGAPPGWYKVLVFADAWALKEVVSARPPTPKWMMNLKYTEPTTTPLSVEVVERPAPGAYDFDVTK
jgi:hypothetical protein